MLEKAAISVLSNLPILLGRNLHILLYDSFHYHMGGVLLELFQHLLIYGLRVGLNLGVLIFTFYSIDRRTIGESDGNVAVDIAIHRGVVALSKEQNRFKLGISSNVFQHL